jgi:hypothetical protein
MPRLFEKEIDCVAVRMPRTSASFFGRTRRAGLASGLMPALLIWSGVAVADDPKKIAEARAACIKLAKTHLSVTSPQDGSVFDDASNDSSDWTDNVFQFRWKTATCRGDANERKITHLYVRDAVLACRDPSNDPRLTSSCALRY